MSAFDALRLEPVHASSRPLELDDASARVRDAPPTAELKRETAQLLDRLADLQQAFYADGRHALLLVLQGRDASGKGSVIKTVIGAINPLGVRVTAFGAPSPEELSHDFLWRVHAHVPAKRMIGVFDRSHYEDVLVVRVHDLVPDTVWRRRFDQINAFEQLLSESGVVIRKCFLHMSRDEQAKQLRERIEEPTKQWKFRLGDLDDRDRWDAFTDAYSDVLTRCSSDHAPWYVVPADSKPLRNYLIAKMMVETLEGLGLEYPELERGVREEGIRRLAREKRNGGG